MPLNDFLPFALGAGSNVMPQAEYDALVARVSGFSSGTAKSRELNKVWRQSAFAVSCIAQFMADYTGNDILDDGDETGFKANLAKAIAMLSMGTDYAVGSNTGNAYSASFTPAVTSLVDGMVLRFKAANTNTGPSTFEPNGLEAKPIVNMKHAALAAGDIQEGGEIWLQYNSSVLGGAWVSILSLGISEASTTVKGIVELATSTETQGGTDAAKAVTPAGLASLTVQLSPPGQVAVFARSTAPTGWLKANGAAVSRTTYAALFAAIGTTFGVGDGSTTFNLPDMRGEFLRGLDDGRGVDAGRALGSWQADDFKAHKHFTSSSLGLATTATGNSAMRDPASPVNTPPGASEQFTGSVGGTETRPRNVALLYCIKI